MTLLYLNAPSVGGVITVDSNIPEAKGYGSSTADCVAAAIATGQALAKVLTDKEIAHLVVQAEVASDSIMFDHAVLFAHREGVVLEDYQKQLPPVAVLGVDTDCTSFVNTVEHPPAAYSARQIECFGVLQTALRQAVATSDVNLLAEVATASARINEAFLPKPRFSKITRIAEECGGLGTAVAHSGTLLSILFDPHDPLLAHRMDEAEKRLANLGFVDFVRFSCEVA